MSSLKLIEIGNLDPKIEHEFISSIKPESGFDNDYYQCCYNEYINKIKPYLLDESKGINLPSNYVPQTTCVLLNNNIPVGLFKIRHYVNEFTKNYAGHIGYIIVNKYRKLGYGYLGLKLAIDKLKSMKDFKDDVIVMSCNVNNIASIKVQQKCGAVIVKQIKDYYLTHIKVK